MLTLICGYSKELWRYYYLFESISCLPLQHLPLTHLFLLQHQLNRLKQKHCDLYLFKYFFFPSTSPYFLCSLFFCNKHKFHHYCWLYHHSTPPQSPGLEWTSSQIEPIRYSRTRLEVLWPKLTKQQKNATLGIKVKGSTN